MADSIDDDWETSSKSSAHSEAPESANRAPTSGDRAEHYRVNVGGDDVVVMSTLEVLEALKVGRINASSLVWKKGMSDWAELGRIPALALLVPSAPKIPSDLKATDAPSSPPKSAPAPSNVSSHPPVNATVKSSPLSPATPVGARRAALPRNPVARVDLSAVRSTSPPVPRPSRPSLASIHPGVLSPLGSRPLNSRPSSPVPSRHDDDDDDDEGVTQVLNTAQLARQMQAERGKPVTSAPESEDKALAVYERPVATLAFAEEVAEPPEEKAQQPVRPGSVAPARIISVGPSEAPRAPARSAPLPSRPSTPPLPSSRPAASAPVQAAPRMRARLPSLPSIVVAPAPAAPAPPVALPPGRSSHVPDSVEPVTTPTPAEIGAGEQEYTHAGRRRRTLVTRNLVVASAGSALLASLLTALAVRRPEPTPLVTAPTLPVTSSAVAAPPPSPAPVPSPPPQEAEPPVPVLSLSALPKAPPAAPKVVRPVAVDLSESAPSTPPPPAPAFLAEAMKGATTKTEKKASEDNPYAVELTDDEPARPAKAPPPVAQEAAAESSSDADSPGF